ncbi:unnamed protein product [Clonostachys chloroleuca]|uniref:Uncharacterized protein n=1 Tax=Clonostachys chloroleuca TaxID=1926264 RepID=A0AA35QEN5_9HYPO|nr:unnamed protein product [Clonostachys chloroleuca]
MPDTNGKIGLAWRITWRMPNGGTATFGPPIIEVHHHTKVDEDNVPSGQEKYLRRKVKLLNFMIRAI